MITAALMVDHEGDYRRIRDEVASDPEFLRTFLDDLCETLAISRKQIVGADWPTLAGLISEKMRALKSDQLDAKFKSAVAATGPGENAREHLKRCLEAIGVEHPVEAVPTLQKMRAEFRSLQESHSTRTRMLDGAQQEAERLREAVQRAEAERYAAEQTSAGLRDEVRRLREQAKRLRAKQKKTAKKGRR